MITYKLKINYQDSKILQSNIELVSGDISAYRLECEFYDNEKRVDISNYSVTLKAKRADGVILSEGGKVADNKGVISLNNDIYAVPGELYLEIALIGSAKNYITTKIILANVLEGLGETDETAGNASSVYVTLLDQVKSRLDSANSVLNEAKQVKTEMEETLSEYAKKEDIEEKLGKKFGVWKPDTEYKTGDFVLTEMETIFTGIACCYRCLNDHISSKTFDGQYWYPEWVFNCSGAIHDHLDNIIAETYATKEELSALETSDIIYDFDETYTITEEETSVNNWVRTVDSNGNPIRLSEMQVDFTIPAGANTGVQYLYFYYENEENSSSPKQMRVSEFAYQHASKERHISVLCYKERETFYAVRGYAWNYDDDFTGLQVTHGARMQVGNFFKDPKPLCGLYFYLAGGYPVAGTKVRIRGKRVDED